ncbi:sugar ABC transporter permease [Arthrobacter sp. NQ7]|uniref:multiple monosaccharide ABC transporter permease n=1 Tax=Arthrobacter sp. NQ7 TaxID=3032303 RepID=UPI00240EAC9F|nr:multiple monosaccharide ABC transporter permease [Arthrobacter sp. NQ7]MDJ0459738.1 sugar ABC transporter permease [Arthrobacter sp. NQ7]
MSALRESLGFLTSRLRQVGIFVALILIVLLFQGLTGGILLEPQNVTNLVVQNSYILILAIGMVMVIIAGHIDLSVGSVAGFIGAVAGVMIVHWGWPWWAAIPACLLVGALVGAWQGYWIAYVGIPAFIVTLAGMLIFRGLTLITLKNQQITPFPAELRALGGGFLPDISGGTSVLEWLTVILGVGATAALLIQALKERRIRRKFDLESEPLVWFVIKTAFTALLMLIITFLLASYRGTPIVLVVLAALVIAYTALMNNSVFGRHTYAIGGNLHAAELSGIKTKTVTFRLFVNMGVLSALAGLVFTARLNSAQPAGGTGFELDSIAAAFIGGAAVTGGIGTVAGAMIGGLIMGVLNNGMSILGLGTDYQQLIKGLVLLVAVGFDIFNKNRSGGGGELGKRFKLKTSPPPAEEKPAPAPTETVEAGVK